MWAARDLHFGGLKARYKHNRRKAVRQLDPATAELVELGRSLQMDNYMLRRYEPGALRLQGLRPGLVVAVRGRERIVPCDLITTYRDGLRLVDLVANTDSAVARSNFEDLQAIAPGYGFVPQLRTREEIRANLVLLQNLDYLAQQLRLYPVRSDALEDAILDAVPGEQAVAVSELCQDLARFAGLWSQPVVSASLFRLYLRGKVVINIREVAYGPGSIVAQC